MKFSEYIEYAKQKGELGDELCRYIYSAYLTAKSLQEVYNDSVMEFNDKYVLEENFNPTESELNDHNSDLNYSAYYNGSSSSLHVVCKVIYEIDKNKKESTNG